MINFDGKGVSKGYCLGTLKFINNEVNIKETKCLSNENSLDLFYCAKEKAISNLNALAEKLRNDGDKTAALLMETHSELAQDLDFNDSVVVKISEENKTAQEAVFEAGEEFAILFEQMDSIEMKARAADIRDVANRISNVIGGKDDFIVLKEPVILASYDISPSLIASIDKSKVLAIVTNKDINLGHTAILARSFGIPMVVGVDNAFSSKYDNMCVIVDGEKGNVFVDPDSKTKEVYNNLMEETLQEKKDLEEFRGKPNKTLSGHEIKLYCNIQNPNEIQTVFDNDAGGIGLFRSEFLFLSKDNPPSEEEQFAVYSKILREMKGNEVVIRTMDIGADKVASYFTSPKEENPALGLRGIRLCFENLDIFKTQLKALFRASVHGNLLIMFPMIADLWEIKKIKEICNEIKKDLLSKKIPVAERIPLGIMIETPAAAIISDILAKEVDFFSCGTNDLVQYTLACDRTGSNTKEYYNQSHLAVKRLLELTVKNAHAAGIPVGVCGEMASDLSFTNELVLLGVDELSVTPNMVLPIRKQISKITEI